MLAPRFLGVLPVNIRRNIRETWKLGMEIRIATMLALRSLGFLPLDVQRNSVRELKLNMRFRISIIRSILSLGILPVNTRIIIERTRSEGLNQIYISPV